jgi:alpha-1,3-rhamnosyl/mannosyltransferase
MPTAPRKPAPRATSRPPVIGIDATAAAVREPTGVAVYLDRLVRALARTAPDVDLRVCYRLSKWPRRRLLPRPDAPNVSLSLYEERLPRALLPRLDLYHGADIRLPGGPVPRVATIHDLYSVTSPDLETAHFRAKRSAQYERAAREALAVITHSEHTAVEVRRTYSLEASRVRACPLGVDPEFTPGAASRAAPVLARLAIVRPFIVFLGLLSRRKNPVAAVRALARMAERGGPPLDLVLAGRDHDALAATLEEARRLGISGRVRAVGYVAREALPPLVASARALVMPSQDEGFGLPALEAMACGCPVVAASRGAIPEVTGGAARLVEPDDVEATATALLEVVEEGDARRRAIEAGRARAALFTWDETARRTLSVYRDVLRSTQGADLRPPLDDGSAPA